MLSEDEKMAAFGRMVFGLMTDVLMMPAGEAYARKGVTMPDGRGGKHKISLIVARPGVADAMEEIAAMLFDIANVASESEGRKQ